MTAGAVGAAKILLGQQRSGDHQTAVHAVVHHLQTPFARQSQLIKLIFYLFCLPSWPELFAHRVATYDAGILHMGVVEKLAAQGIAGIHLAGQHQHVEAVEIGFGLLAALLLDEGQDEIALAHRLIGCGEDQYHGEDEEQEKVDFGSNGEAHEQSFLMVKPQQFTPLGASGLVFCSHYGK